MRRRASLRRLQFCSPTLHARNHASGSSWARRTAVGFRTRSGNDRRFHAAKSGGRERFRANRMITALAWMPLALSVTLSALLTAILLLVATLRARQSPEFAAMI